MTTNVDRLTAALSRSYRIERELGQGGMATVYLAQDIKHDRKAAIKVLKPELAAVIGADRFLKEIKVTANLQHPHILGLIDSGEVDGLLWYAMPFVEGESLRDRLTREKQLPISEAVRIATEVSSALDYAHRRGVIHRDIKPENILLHDGSAMVADFGIALAASTAGSRMTETGMSLGTPNYMSPEQAMGERTLDARTDVYALGCVLYEMLTGDPPFTGSTAQAIVAKVMTEKPVDPSRARDTIPGPVEEAVLTALQKLPADRFATAAEFSAALREGATVIGQRRRAVAPSAATPAGRLAWPVLTAVALAAAAWGWLRPGRPFSGTAPWSASFTLPDSLALDPFSNNPEGLPTIALSPDGSKLVFVARHGNRTRLYLRQLADFSVRALDGTEGAIAPFFSPAGDATAFFAANELKRVTLADGQVRTLSPILSDPFGGVWLPDGRILVSNRRATQLILFGANGDSLRTFPCDMCSLPEPLSDGRHAIVTSRSGLHVMDLATGGRTALRRWESQASDDAIRGTMARLDGDGHLLYVGPGGQLNAAPFDATRGIVTGASVSVTEGVRVESGRGAAQLAVSRRGVIAWAQGGVPGEGLLVAADRSGTLDTIPSPAANYNAIDITPDGRRLVVRVGMATGDMALQVIDVGSGRVTPWFNAPTIAGAKWMPDGRRVLYTLDSGTFIADPESSAPPRALALPRGAREVSAMTDTASYRAWLDNSMVILHTDGRPMEQLLGQIPVGGNTPDDRWFMSEEVGGSESAIVARSLDGRGRRLVIAGGSRFSQVAWAAGGEEFIVVDVGNEFVTTAEDRDRSDPSRGRVVQSFYAVRYDPANPDTPFGEPRRLFSAAVSDFPGRNYTVALGGNRFVFKQRSAESPLREVRLLGNWHARLAAVAR